MNTSIQEAKVCYASALAGLAKLPPEHWPEALGDMYHADVAWHGPHPINSHQGAAAVLANFWRPFLAALPDLERRDDILLTGEFKNGDWVGATGYYTGTFTADWLGIPATGKVLNVRFGEFSRIEDGKVREVYLILDILDVLRQAGRWPALLPRSPGPDDRVPGPSSMDGVMLGTPSPDEGLRSLKLVEAMIKGLMEYDGKSLESMAQERFWHPSMMWYGPSGIGTSRGLKGFQDVHQRTFLTAFPDRIGGDHKARIGEGAYVGSTGWPSVRATHCGPWLGAPATQQRISMRVMDFWRREDDLLRENWVFIDQLDLLLQMGCDVMDMVR
ncbi:ester cyclase [Undibacterium sp. Ji22W]|uniref:ester cyclase n=1 Tax=Undibacterium sp. Ji22W TaxID=3413038 RepID=UPI003BF0E4DE